MSHNTYTDSYGCDNFVYHVGDDIRWELGDSDINDFDHSNMQRHTRPNEIPESELPYRETNSALPDN